jgi:hypothetical protein
MSSSDDSSVRSNSESSVRRRTGMRRVERREETPVGLPLTSPPQAPTIRESEQQSDGEIFCGGDCDISSNFLWNVSKTPPLIILFLSSMDSIKQILPNRRTAFLQISESDDAINGNIS